MATSVDPLKAAPTRVTGPVRALGSPTISIVMPALNQERYIGQAIASVLAQSFESWELLVVDDGSQDTTGAVVSGFDDARITLLSQARQGVSAARNHALAQSSGAYIAYLDADDVYLPDTLEILMLALQANPSVGLSYGGYVRIDEQNRMLSSYYPLATADCVSLLTGFPVTISCVLLRRDWHEKTNGFNTAYVINEDRDYFVRLALAGCMLLRADAALIFRRVYTHRVEGDLQTKIANQQAIFSNYAAQSSVAPKIESLVRETQRLFYVEWAFQSALSENQSVCLECLDNALRFGTLESKTNLERTITQVAEAATRSPGDAQQRVRRFLALLPGQWKKLLNERHRLVATTHLLQGLRAALWPHSSSHANNASAFIAFEEANAHCADIATAAFWLLKYDLDSTAVYLGQDYSLDVVCNLAGNQQLSSSQRALFSRLARESRPEADRALYPEGKTLVKRVLARIRAFFRIIEPVKNRSLRSLKARGDRSDNVVPCGRALLSIVHYGSIEQLKPQLDAAAKLHEEFDDLRYTLVVQDVKASDEAGLRTFASHAWCRLVLNPSSEQLEPVWQSASLFVADTSTIEVAQVLRAQQQGLPVVAAKGTTAALHIKHQLTGWLLPAATEDEWQKGLRALLQDHQLRTGLSVMAFNQLRLGTLVQRNLPTPFRES